MHNRARRVVLLYAFSLSVITYLDRVCISAAAPAIMRDLRLSILDMSFVFSAFTLAYSLFEVPSGWMADVMGPRRVLTRIVVWWSGFTILSGVAWSYRSLLVLRFLFGAGEAGAVPGMSRSLSRWFPIRERGKANAYLFFGSRLGGALAPALALLLIGAVGWRATFAMFGSIGFAWAAAWFWWYRDDPAAHPAVTREELAWIRQDDLATETARTPWRAIFSSPNLYAISAMYFTFGYGLYFYFTWLPTYLVQVLGFSAMAGGLFAGLPFVLAGGANLAGGYLTDRLSGRYGLRVGRCWLGCASFVSCGALLLASTVVSSAIAKAILIAVALGCADLALGACWAVCLDVGWRSAGVVTGVMNTFGNLGGVIGPLVVGLVVERWRSWTIPFHVAGVVYVIGGVMWLVINPNEPIRPAPPHQTTLRTP
jgi:MFS family permease